MTMNNISTSCGLTRNAEGNCSIDIDSIDNEEEEVLDAQPAKKSRGIGIGHKCGHGRRRAHVRGGVFAGPVLQRIQ